MTSAISGAGDRMHASDGPQTCSAAAISHASSGGFGEIAERRLARPRPVLGLVEEEIDGGEAQPDEADDREGDKDEGCEEEMPVGR